MIILDLLASIPSPSFNDVNIGGFLTLRMYGLMIGIGVVVGIFIATKRWERLGGTSEDISSIALWSIPAGIFGAKIYHVLTSLPDKSFLDIFKVWTPGLGIPGALVGGFLAGWLVARNRGINISLFLHAVVPAIPVAQAIGRLGNWFNQELFGRPTDLPWGLQISDDALAANGSDFYLKYSQYSTFHPTFLYEALWNIGLYFVLINLDKRSKIRSGQMLPAYLVGYGLGRFIVESFRIDDAAFIGPFRVNSLVSLSAVLIGLLFLYLNRNKEVVSTYASDVVKDTKVEDEVEEESDSDK